MAFTILEKPQDFASVYAPMILTVDSDNKSLENFRYTLLIDCEFQFVGSAGTTFDIFTTMAKTPGNGYGTIDIHDYLRPYISHTSSMPIGSQGFGPNPDYGTNYRYALGEQYDSWPFTGSFNDGGFVAFSSSTIKHDLIVGDEVQIVQDTPYTNYEFNGIHNVLAVNAGKTTMTVDVPWQSTPAGEGGKARHADGSSMVFSGINFGGRGLIYGIGYGLPIEEYYTFDCHDYIHNTGLYAGPKFWMTNAPNYFRMPPNGNAFIPIHYHETKVGALQVFTYDKDNHLLSGYSFAYSSTTTPFAWALVGPKNMPFGDDPNVARYQVGIDDTLGSQTMAYPYSFTIDRRCTNYDTFTLMFLDKRGAWMSYAFTLRSDERHRVDKKTYSLGNNTTPHSSGYRTLNLEHWKELTLRSNAMNDAESLYFMELLASPSVWLLNEDGTEITPVVLDDGQWIRQQTLLQDPDIYYECTVSKAYKEVVPI